MHSHRLYVVAFALVLVLGACAITPNGLLAVTRADAQGDGSGIMIEADNKTVADTAKYTFSLELEDVWGAGFLNVTFPEGYGLGGMVLALTGTEPGNPSSLCIDGVADIDFDPATRNLSVAPEWVNSDCSEDANIELVIRGIVNPTTAGTYEFEVAVLGEDYQVLQDGAGSVVLEAAEPSFNFTLQPPAQVKAGEGFEVSVEARDEYGNLVDLTEPVGLGLDTDAAFDAVLTSTDTGNSTFTVWVNKTGDHSLWAEHPDLDDVESEGFLVEAGDPDPGLSTVEADPDTIPADGEAVSKITVRLKDKFGNPVTAGSAVVCLSLSQGSGTLTSGEGSTGCATAEVRADADEGGSYNASLVSETVGDVAVNASVNGMELDAGASIKVTGTAGGAEGPAEIVLSAEAMNITADGQSSTRVMAWFEDSDSNKLVLVDELVCIGTSLGNLSGERGDCDEGYVEAAHEQNGSYSVELTSSTQAGTATITGKWEGLANTTMVGFRPGAPSMLSFDPPAPPAMVVAGNNFTMSVVVLDAHGNRVDEGSLEATIAIEAGPEGGQIGGFTTIIVENGTDEFLNLSVNRHGEYILRAESANLTPAMSEAFMVHPLIDLASFNRALQTTVQVTATDEGNKITWDPDAYVEIEKYVTGILVWRINSPAEQIDFMESGSSVFLNSSYLDEGGDPGARYILTLCVVTGEGCYHGDGSPITSILDVPEYEGSLEADLFETAAFVDGDGPFLSGTLLRWGLAAGIALLGGVAGYLWTRSRRDKGNGQEGPEFDQIERHHSESQRSHPGRRLKDSPPSR